MKKTTLLCIMACIAMLAACADYDDEDNQKGMVDLDALQDGIATSYQGYWRYNSSQIDVTASEKYQSQTTLETTQTLVRFMPAESKVIIESMPTNFFLACAGLDGAKVVGTQPYTMTLYAKGYSQNTEIFGLNMSDYVFTCSANGGEHQVKVTFDNMGELSHNSYLRTIIIIIRAVTVSVNGQTIPVSDGVLTLQTE